MFGLIAVLALLTGCASQPALEPEAASERPGTPIAPTPADPAETIQVRREQAIAAYLDYLERYPSSPESLQIRRRLADLMLDSAAELAATTESSAASAMQRGVSRDERLTGAIDIYESLLRQDPQAHTDTELWYQLARAYDENAQPEKAMAIFERLIEDPVRTENRLYADAQFRRGEILFGKGSFQLAENAYRAVVSLGDSVAVFEQATYKLGWSLFKQGRYEDALQVFFSILDRKAPPSGSFSAYMSTLSSAEQEQVSDVLRAIGLCFSYLAGPDSIAAYFNLHEGRTYERRIYQDLAELYERKELFTDAAVTYLALAQRAPQDRRAPRLFVESIRLYRLAGLANKALETQAAFVDGYGLASGFWEHRSVSACPAVLASLQSSLVDLADHYHEQALVTHQEADYREAERWYRAYLAWFNETQRADEMHYQLAELLFEAGQYASAAAEFEHIAYQRAGHAQAAEAGLAAIVAYERLEGRGDHAAVAGESSRKTTSAIRFATTYPNHPKAAAVFSQVGVELLERNQDRTAIQVCETLLQTAKPSSTGLRQAAWSVLAQARYKVGDYANAEQAYREALSLTEPNDPRRDALNKGMAATVYKLAEAQRAEGDERASAALFLRAAKAAPGTSVAVTAEYDAASALLASQQWKDAIKVLEAFRTDYPAHSLQQEATKKLAFAYVGDGRYLDAAAIYRQLGTGAGEDALRRSALVRAAELYEQGSDLPQAIEALALYAREFPRPASEVIEVYWKLAAFEKARGNTVQNRYWLQRVIEAERLAGDVGGVRMRTLAGEGTLELAGYQIESFRRIRLVEPLQASLGKKLSAMRLALNMLEAATGYQIDSVSSAATYQTASLYRELSEALRASERPTGVGSEQMVQYERELEEQATGFEHKAIEIYQAHASRVSEDQSDRWTTLSRKWLYELQPKLAVEEEKRAPAVAAPK
ncbi:MAG: tetratricopeptide repeat protein [Sedimenticolaceae bacterium]